MRFSILFDERRKRKERQRTKVLQEAERLSTLLSQRFSYEKLYLFGSVARNRGFTIHSDIDLAIKGLNRDLFLKVYAFLIKESDFPIDLMPWELLDKRTRQSIEKEGILLYGKR